MLDQQLDICVLINFITFVNFTMLQASQPYPDRACFALPPSDGLKFNVLNEGRSGALVTVVEQPSVGQACRGVSFPPTQYELHFRRRDSEKVKHQSSLQPVTHIENGILDKETE